MSWTPEDVAAHYARLKQPQEGATPAPSRKTDWSIKHTHQNRPGQDICFCGEPEISPMHHILEVPDRLEAPIQAEILKLLEEDGWRILITNPVSDRGRGKGFGEIGMADALAIRYMRDVPDKYRNGSEECQLCWIEFKRGKGGVLSSKQREWHIRERARGALTVILGEDCPESVEGWKEWYRASGMARRRGL